jgi:hypothetical protein
MNEPFVSYVYVGGGIHSYNDIYESFLFLLIKITLHLLRTGGGILSDDDVCWSILGLY